MSRSYWFAGIAVGLTCFASLAQETAPPPVKGEPIPESGQQQSAPSSDAIPKGEQSPVPNIAPALDAIESAIRDLIAEEDQIERQRQIDNDARDLSAQEAMAKWAYWMFMATLATVLLTAAALMAIIRTLHHTRRAADYAKGMVVEAEKTTEAAQASVAETRRIGEAQVRAYISISSIQLRDFFPDSAFSYHFDVKNVGQSPAMDFTFAYCATFIEASELETGKVPRGKIHWNKVPTNLAVGQVTTFDKSWKMVTIDSFFKEVMSGEWVFAIFGSYKYKTVFGRTRRGVFNFQMIPSSYKNGVFYFSSSEKHNKAN